MTRSTPTDLLSARLQGAAKRLAGWHPPEGQARQVAIADLQAIAGDNTEAYAQAAGVMLGAHPTDGLGDAQHRGAAYLLLDAARLREDDTVVQRWIAVGEENRAKARAAHAAGDVWGAQRLGTRRRLAARIRPRLLSPASAPPPPQTHHAP